MSIVRQHLAERGGTICQDTPDLLEKNPASLPSQHEIVAMDHLGAAVDPEDLRNIT
jgi:hypothetical protein